MKHDVTVKASVNDAFLGEVTYRIEAPSKSAAHKTALSRQMATLRQQFPDSKSRSVEVVESERPPTFGPDGRHFSDEYIAYMGGPIEAVPVHTVRGKPIGPEGSPYGVTHDMDCPGCVDTPFTASPRSETYWSS